MRGFQRIVHQSSQKWLALPMVAILSMSAAAQASEYGQPMIRELSDQQLQALTAGQKSENLALAPAHPIKDADAMPSARELALSPAVWSIPTPSATPSANPCGPRSVLPDPGDLGPFVPLVTIPDPTPSSIIPAPLPTVTPAPVPSVPVVVPTPVVCPSNPWNPTYPIIGGGTGIVGQIGDVVVILNNIVNIAKSVWEFIKNGQAVVNIKSDFADALPQGVTSPLSQMAGWIPKSKNFEIIIPHNTDPKKNIEFTFRISFNYNGNFQGKGRYMTDILVQPADYHVNWGQALNITVRIPSDGIVNASANVQDPLAAAMVYLDWSRSKIFSMSGASAAFYVRADGLIQDMSAPDNSPPTPVNPIGN